MRTSILQGIAVFALGVTFAAAASSAQSSVRSTSPRSAVVSVDILRHPISSKVLQRLRAAMKKIDAGDHEAAIPHLLETLKKFPDSAPYAYNLLGVAYVKTDQFKAAVSSFEQAVLLLPHDPTTHYNYGLALLCAGDHDRATQEVQRALQLDPRNRAMQARLNSMLEHNPSGN